MDTLSRKHRLKQQVQQFSRNHQMPYGNESQQAVEFENVGSIRRLGAGEQRNSSTKSAGFSRRCERERMADVGNDNVDDVDDDDEYSVFEVVEVGTNTRHDRTRGAASVRSATTRTQQPQQQQQQLDDDRADRSQSHRQRQQRTRVSPSNEFTTMFVSDDYNGNRQAQNFKGDAVDAVRNGGGRQIERRNENDNVNDFDRYESYDYDEDDCNHHHRPRNQRRKEHSIYEVGLASERNYSSNHHLEQQQQQQREYSSRRNHAINSNHYQSKSLSTLNGSSTTKSTGGNSSSGFSSSNGSYSSSSQQQHQQQQQQQHRRQPSCKDDHDCVVSVSNNNKHQHHRRGHHESQMGKRSKLIDDLDRLLMPPGEPATATGDALNGGSINSPSLLNDKDQRYRRRSSLVSPTESHLSIMTTASGQRGAGDKFDSTTTNDFDYSTLCRDEFSSFIPIVPSAAAAPVVKSMPPQMNIVAPNNPGFGPMLVGIHEVESANDRLRLLPNDNNVVDEMSDDEPVSDKTDPYEDELRTRQTIGGNNYGSSMDHTSESPPMISTSPSCGSSAGPENPYSPIVCQNYSLEMTAVYDEDYDDHVVDDGEDYDGNECSRMSIESEGIDTCNDIVKHKPIVVQDCDLSEMLDIYVEKVNSLIRLTQGDKSISIQEAFKFDDYRQDCFEVRAEHKTPIACVEAPRCGREEFMRIIQEVELEDESTTRDEYQPIEARRNHRTIVTHVSKHGAPALEHQQDPYSSSPGCPLKSILESIQLSPELSWSCKKLQQENAVCDNFLEDLVSNSSDRRSKRIIDIKCLEESFIRRLGLNCNELAGDSGMSATHQDVAPIRMHIREFIQDYRNYQMELSQATSFGDGSWHENWLFASKRPRSAAGEPSIQSDYGSRLFQGVSCAKRARMSNTSNEQSREPEQRKDQEDKGQVSACEKADLIKYSTLILARCKPVKLTLAAEAAATVDDDDDDNNKASGHHYQRHHKSDQRRHSDLTSHIKGLYEAQLERVSELELVAIESSRQPDVCQLLLCDTDSDDDGDYCGDTMDSNNNNSNKRTASRRNKPLLVSYDCTSVTPELQHANKFYFTASGYLFQTSLIRFSISGSRQRAKLVRKILDRVITCMDEQSSSRRSTTETIMFSARAEALARPLVGGQTTATLASEAARFVISLSNIELINRLPVIQFCAKISGSLPIRVRWFRQSKSNGDNQCEERDYEELSDIIQTSTVAKRKNLSIKSTADRHSDWPIEMQASYDYEYQTCSGSWFRFRRNKDEILFEIREPNLDSDYNRAYKCLIENTVSRKECKFHLTTRRIVNSALSSAQPVMKSRLAASRAGRNAAAVSKREVGNDGHALLRTWSQRTLNKPQPSEPKVPTDAEQQQHQHQHQHQISYNHHRNADHPKRPVADGGGNSSSRQQTVGHLSASSMNADKFGKNFPYHPENLLKRLEENKFSIPAKRNLVSGGGGAAVVAAAASSATMNDCHLTSGELFELNADESELDWSVSKVPIDDEAGSYYSKQPAREKLANNSSCNNNSELDSTHADSTRDDSLANSVSNNKENLECHRQVGHSQIGIRVEERPRAVINLQPPSSGFVVDLIDDSGRLRPLAKQRQEIERNHRGAANDRDESAPGNHVQSGKTIEQPKPRLRLSQTVQNQATHRDDKEHKNERDGIYHHDEHRSGKNSIDQQDATILTNRESDFERHHHEPQQHLAAELAGERNSRDGALESTRNTPPKSNHQKPGINVKSLISRFSMA